MRILVACELPEFALDELRGLGSEVLYEPQISAAALAQHVGQVGILVVDQTPVTAEALVQGRALQMIVVAGSGSGQVAVDMAAEQGILVTHCPHKDAVAAAELALGLMLALDREIVDNAVALRAGHWERGRFLQARGLAGRTLGIIGSDEFTRTLAPRAKACQMHVIAWRPEAPTVPEQYDDIEYCNWPRELARRSEVVVLQTPLGPGVDFEVDADFLKCMKTGAALVHVGDHCIVDEAALLEALAAQQLRVALDVLPGAPPGDAGRVKSALLQHPRVIGTHRVAGVTEQARQAIATEVVRIVAAFLISGEIVNALNISERSPATWQLVLRVRDQVGVMAGVLDAVRADGINAEEITIRVFHGAKAAWCNVALDERPSTEALEAIRALPDVLHLELRAVV